MHKTKYILAYSESAQKYVQEHILIVETVLGRSLPNGVEIHHVDSNGRNNKNANLVVCPNAAYHHLLHKRTRALEACGNANFLKCWICKRWDDPSRITIRSSNYIGTTSVHKSCEKERSATRYLSRQSDH